ncbi:hypothetical protein IV203_004197 [Nitzschia inconspicua]|uniref:Uncharacterized protein n=1 Tax=Nitzschia inconspicua TaxID=303405 RepID=A0A9K3L4Z0_9STRA|nr:hypothetical protein IV203_004197 [Nitzschia inconspicua]
MAGNQLTITVTGEVSFDPLRQCKDQSFVETNRERSRPLAILALATVIAEKVLFPNSPIHFHDIFDGISMRVPDCSMSYDNPEYHSIVGQYLLVVDWKTAYGIEVPCPTCNNPLKNDPTHWSNSNHKNLFPIFGIDGPPKWALVMSMTCSCCGGRFDANDGSILCKIPVYAAASYPVEPKFAQNRSCHIARTATELFDTIMTTHGNGDLCSHLLYNAINREYLSKVSSYYSYYKTHPTTSNIIEYPVKDGQYIKVYPPSGSFIRDVFDEASRQPRQSLPVDEPQRQIQGISDGTCQQPRESLPVDEPPRQIQDISEGACQQPRESLPVDGPQQQIQDNPRQQLITVPPQQQRNVSKPVEVPIAPNIVYFPHPTILMWPLQAMPLPPVRWMPPQQLMHNGYNFNHDGFCCYKYCMWYRNRDRKGRPPHEHHCLDLRRNMKEMRLRQEENNST